MMYIQKTLFQGIIAGNGGIPNSYFFENSINWKLTIYVSAVSGISPTLNINFYIDALFTNTYIPLPTITTTGYYVVEYVNGDLIYTQLNTNGQIIQRVYLGKYNPMADIYMNWTVGGTSPSFTVQIAIRQPKVPGEEV